MTATVRNIIDRIRTRALIVQEHARKSTLSDQQVADYMGLILTDLTEMEKVDAPENVVPFRHDIADRQSRPRKGGFDDPGGAA